MSTIYDVGIIGMGVAGSFAAYRLAKESKLKIIGFDIGRPPQKRRRALEGFFGCLPSSDGKLYINDTSKLTKLVGSKKAKAANNYFNKILNNIYNYKITKDKDVLVGTSKKMIKNGFNYFLNDYIQMYPKEIHALSKFVSDEYDKHNTIQYAFDTEICQILKQNGNFVIHTTDKQEFKCKKIIFGPGRIGWRFANNIFKHFGIIENNDIAKIGVRVECNSSLLKEYNKSNCTILKDKLEIGPLSWNGTVIPEDHIDVALSSFRSNENRWKSDKVSFNLISDEIFPDRGAEEADRLSKLTFILTNDRVLKEKISLFLNNKSKISIISEFSFLKEAFNELFSIMPTIENASFHIPTIITNPPKINIGDNLESDMSGMYIVGESTGVSGILAAAESGLIAANEIIKG